MGFYVRPKVAAEQLDVSVKLVYKLVARGELQALKIGRCVRISLASLNDFIARNTQQRGEPLPAKLPPSSPPPIRRRPRSPSPTGFVFLPPKMP